MTRLALKEWALACDAIASGDMLVTLRKGGIREKEFLVRGERFWLVPTYEHQQSALVAPMWRDELVRTAHARPGDGSVPVRVLCEVHAAHAVDGEDALERLAPFHVWTADYAARRLGWRPTKPLWALVLRAYALPEPVRMDAGAIDAGCRSWLELPAALAEDDLLPALTDDAFELHVAQVEAALGARAVTI